MGSTCLHVLRFARVDRIDGCVRDQRRAGDAEGNILETGVELGRRHDRRRQCIRNVRAVSKLVQCAGERAQFLLRLRQIATELVAAVASIQPAFHVAAMPLRCQRPQIHVQDLGDRIGKLDATRVCSHRRPRLREHLPKALQGAGLGPVLVWQRLRRNPRAQLREKLVGGALVGRPRCGWFHFGHLNRL